MLGMPASVSCARTRSARDVVAPVTTIARRTPRTASASGNSLTRPAPKRMSAAVTRSNRAVTERPPLYQPASSGETLTYRVACRGRAIIGATVSRQTR